jgi:hypothetical protein
MPFKEILLSVVLIIGLSLFLVKYNFLNSSLIALSVAIIGAVKIAIVSIIPIVPTRLLFVPALIKFQHFEVFKNYLNKLYYSEGLIGKIFGINYPYSKASGFVVDRVPNREHRNQTVERDPNSFLRVPPASIPEDPQSQD